MPADAPRKPSASPLAGAPASASRTPDKPDEPRSATEHRKVGSGQARAAGWWGGETERGTRSLSHPQYSKPVMEKRRRARINESLAQLKTLILDAVRKDSSRHSKLEKADILEMTVTHLQNLRRLQVTAALSSDPAVLGKYRAGFNECLVEVTRFLAGCEGVWAEVRSRLLGHLAACLLQLGSSRRPASLPAAAEDPASEVYAGRPLLRSFDGPFPLLRPGAAFTPLFAPGLTPAPPVVPRVGPQGRNGPWRPWLQ
ncbi:transcription factor HES-4 isoform X1 [Sciurus carolinensis]|uniref:transcription factor HES-4 isoform X1 n=1 Tax=Sciurus carolinensis TaxID=30640 RepID=UPI001FB24241|nr:transcription factor HES-4 isoform X1 [Sciurus carolinensis]XP_047394490.1 transcription factor HES-4 isoform X1 [Sciurus carolinensis]XP_047394500.1 transcription factor HES-4 isoform X1 [Sciurus carolinensis]